LTTQQQRWLLRYLGLMGHEQVQMQEWVAFMRLADRFAFNISG